MSPVSCGDDGAIQVWDLESGELRRTLRRDRPYERLDISEVQGLTDAQRATLRALGAIEEWQSGSTLRAETVVEPVPGLAWSLGGVPQFAKTCGAPGLIRDRLARHVWSHYICSARPEFFNRRKATRAMANERATPIAKVICGVIQRPTSA